MRAWSWIANNFSSAFGFGIVQPITGTSPTATVQNDTLTFTSSNGSVGIAGNSGTKTIDFTVTPAGYTVSAISSNTNAVSGTTYNCDTTAGAFNVTLPAPTTGRYVIIVDSVGNFETNQVTVVRNGGEKIENIAASYICYASYGAWLFVADGTNWKVD